MPGTSGFALLGGRNAQGEPVNDVHVAWVAEASTNGRLLAWQPLEGLALPEPRADAVAASIADFVYLVGGEGPLGPTSSVFRLGLSDREPAVDETGRLEGWAIAPAEEALPEARSDAVSFAASSSIYVIGGIDESGEPQDSMLWTVPDTVTGDLGEGWTRLEETDLPMPITTAPAAGVGSMAFIIGGATGETGGVLSDDAMRAGLAPKPPFFQLGIAGATLPALSIKGEVGQQLGYLNAMGVGMTNFVILVIIGLAFSHQRATKRIFVRLSRGRLKMPPEEEYGP